MILERLHPKGELWKSRWINEYPEYRLNSIDKKNSRPSTLGPGFTAPPGGSEYLNRTALSWHFYCWALGYSNDEVHIIDIFTCSVWVKNTGSFDRSVIFHTPIKSWQKCSLRLILAEKSSLVHDIWWIYIPFNVVSPWKTSIDIKKNT